MTGFESLAAYYDRFVGADYEQIIQFIDQTLKSNLPDASLVCDIGCGSGTVTLGLLEKGYDMIGIDGSVEMLTEAMNKRSSLDNGEKALFLCQQLPDFELYGTVDAIISTLDTVNYLTDPKDLEKLFYWVRNYLNPNGLFIFDVNTLYKYQEVLNGYSAVYEEDSVFFTWRSFFENGLCCHQLTYFTKAEVGYVRRDEEQQQRYYSPREIDRVLNQYGFELLGVYDDYSVRAPQENSQRITYVARAIKE